MISESQIRERLGRYLQRGLSLDQFEDWIAEQSWNMHKDSSEEAQGLAAAIELRLVEHSSGHLDEEALRDDLRQFANPSVINVIFGDAHLTQAVGPPNNAITSADTNVFSFTSRLGAPPAVGATQAGVGFSGTRQLVVPA